MGHLPCRPCRYLVEAGAAVEVKDERGQSPLDLAWAEKHHHVAKYLMDKVGCMQEEEEQQ